MRMERLGPFLLRQPPGVFPLGEDALRLAAFATARRGWRVCDLGTGSGCLLLLLSGRSRPPQHETFCPLHEPKAENAGSGELI